MTVTIVPGAPMLDRYRDSYTATYTTDTDAAVAVAEPERGSTSIVAPPTGTVTRFDPRELGLA